MQLTTFDAKTALVIIDLQKGVLSFPMAHPPTPVLEKAGRLARAWGAFYGTALDLQLRRRGVTQVVLCGIATSIGVESTARDADEHGYNVSLVVDAMTDMKVEAHDNSIGRIFPRLGETGTTDAALALLEKST